jgi:hypothetical protein
LQGEVRRVNVLVGKKTYSILTRLDEQKFKAVLSIVKEAVESVESSVDQEQRLLLGCLKMAYKIEEVTRKLEEALKERA